MSGRVEPSYDPDRAFSRADIVFVTTPSFMADKIAETLAAWIKPTADIFLVPGTGGMECPFVNALPNNRVFGLQRVPSVARLIANGKVYAEGYRAELHLAALPKSEAYRGCRMIEDIFDMPCEPLPDYLNVTLVPSNPILHTTRLYSLFKDYRDGKVYDRIPLFYEHWSDDTSEILFECDDEVQKLCRTLPEFDLSYVRSLREHYESDTPSALTAKIRSIKGFKGLATPSVAVNGGYIPDFDSRYFTADFSYGLQILCQIADMVGSPAPNMKKVLDWYLKLKPSKGFDYADYGITDLARFKEFYSK